METRKRGVITISNTEVVPTSIYIKNHRVYYYLENSEKSLKDFSCDMTDNIHLNKHQSDISLEDVNILIIENTSNITINVNSCKHLVLINSDNIEVNGKIITQWNTIQENQ